MQRFLFGLMGRSWPSGCTVRKRQAPSRGDETVAVRAIEKLGGKVRVLATDFSGKPFVKVVFSYTKVMDVGLKEPKDLKTLIGLNLMGTQVTDSGLNY